MPSLSEARDELRTAADRFIRAERRIVEYASEQNTWTSVQTAETGRLRTAAERARQQRDQAMQQLTRALGGADDE
ncbi:MAG: hypothetical protein EXR64_06060 [Dehalococcoidia bacterium]|nr:hypothetical protein [Dehalococcoidia bacterium]